MPSSTQVRDQIADFILSFLEELKESGEIPGEAPISHETSLVGDEAFMDSRSLVELLIALEEFIDEKFSAEFDWTSDRAMSSRNSPLRTPATLAEFAANDAGL